MALVNTYVRDGEGPNQEFNGTVSTWEEVTWTRPGEYTIQRHPYRTSAGAALLKNQTGFKGESGFLNYGNRNQVLHAPTPHSALSSFTCRMWSHIHKVLQREGKYSYLPRAIYKVKSTLQLCAWERGFWRRSALTFPLVSHFSKSYCFRKLLIFKRTYFEGLQHCL